MPFIYDDWKSFHWITPISVKWLFTPCLIPSSGVTVHVCWSQVDDAGPSPGHGLVTSVCLMWSRGVEGRGWEMKILRLR